MMLSISLGSRVWNPYSFKQLESNVFLLEFSEFFNSLCCCCYCTSSNIPCVSFLLLCNTLPARAQFSSGGLTGTGFTSSYWIFPAAVKMRGLASSWLAVRGYQLLAVTLISQLDRPLHTTWQLISSKQRRKFADMPVSHIM